MLRLICATRLNKHDFASKTLLGRSLKQPIHQGLHVTVAFENRLGLPEVYNSALSDYPDDLLVFCHDDLALPAQSLSPLLTLYTNPQ